MPKPFVVLLFLSILISLSSCSRNRANPPEAAIDRIRPLATILIRPVPVPEAMFTDNRSPPVIGWLWVSLANTLMDKEKSASFDARYASFRTQSGDRLAEHVRRELVDLGFSVRVVGREGKGAGQPAADAILGLRIDTLAMYSRRLDSNYLPTIDTSAWLAEVATPEDGLIQNSYIYGAYADRDGDGYITSDPRFAFPNFEALLAQPDLVEQSFDDGLRKTARQIAQDIRKEYRPAPPPMAAARVIAAPKTSDVPAEQAGATAKATKTTAVPKKPGPGRSTRTNRQQTAASPSAG